MFRNLFGRKSSAETAMVIVRMNDRAQPLDRGELYEDPLQSFLQKNSWGEVSGGGTQLSENGEIEFCDIELQLTEASSEVLRAIGDELERLGAPVNSRILSDPELSFGRYEGLAIYLNGTDLPNSTYQECDSNFVYSEFNRLLSGIGSVHSHWQGPTETALYVYGCTAEEMEAALRPFLDSYPLCDRARVVKIA